MNRLVQLCVSQRKRWELVAAASLVVLVTVVIGAGSYFDRDDLLFAQYFEVNPVTPGVLVRSWFGHLMPGYIASVILFLKVFGLSWPAALTFIALIHAGAFVAFTRILDAVLGRVRLNIIVGLAFSLSLGPLAVRLWWAATLNNMLALALGLAVLGCATRWVMTRRSRHLVAALLLFALALAMSEKNLLFSLHIAAWCTLVVWRGLPIRERLHEILRAWPLWTGLAAIAAVDALAFVTGPYVDESGEASSVPFSLEFIAHNLVGGLVPSLFGLDLVNEAVSLLDPRVVLPALLLVGFVVWTVVRVPSNGGVWLFALIAVGANAAVLSRRAEMIGLAGSRNLRYLLESTAFLWLAIGVVLVVTLKASLQLARTRGTSNVAVRWGMGALAVGLVVVLAASAWAWTSNLSRAIAVSGGYAARVWVSALNSTLPHPAPPIIDSPLPTTFGMPALYPFDMVSLLLPSLGWPDVQTTNALEGAWVIGPDGVAGPARLASADTQFAGHRCTDGQSDVEVPEVSSEGRSYLLVDFSNATGESVAIHGGGRWMTVSRPHESNQVVVYFPDAIDGDVLINAQGATICVDAVTTADILPDQSAQGAGG